MVDPAATPPSPHPERKPMRLAGFDCSTRGGYFVTIVVSGRRCLFGRAVDGVLRLNAAGRMVDEALLGLSAVVPGACVPAKVVMPNHVHLLLAIRPLAAERGVTLGSVIGSWKSFTTRSYWAGARLGKFDPIDGPLWQRGYYDHIVRDAEDYDRIIWYIQSNPARWCVDRDNPTPGLM